MSTKSLSSFRRLCSSVALALVAVWRVAFLAAPPSLRAQTAASNSVSRFIPGTTNLAPLAAPPSATLPPGTLQSVPGYIPRVTANLQSTGTLPADQVLKLAITLPLRNQAGLDWVLGQLYNPASIYYHHYYTPEQFKGIFGPTEADYQAVVNFANSHGLTVVGTHDSRQILEVQATVSSIEQAFHINLLTYQHPTEARQFFAPDVDPTVDPALPISDIAGLSDYGEGHSAAHGGADFGVVDAGGSANGYLYGTDFRSAYLPGVAANGSGQMVGIVAFDGYYTSDITNYEYYEYPFFTNVPLQNILLGGSTGLPQNVFPIEVPLDIEMAIAMAPGLAKVVVFESTNVNNLQQWYTIFDAMKASNQISQFSCSYYYTGFFTNTNFDASFKQMAAQGQSFFTCSGDTNAYESADNDVLPAFNPNVTCVGGTTLFVTNNGALYVSETTWNDLNENIGTSNNPGTNRHFWVGSSGGTNGAYSLPWWQQGLSLPQQNLWLNSSGSGNRPNV